ncbi:MAG: glutamate--cysteine ligase, partial [Pseudomonadota bacterium]
MGIEINQTEFSDAEAQAFCERLEHNLDALEVLLARPGFGIGPGSVGAELEIYLVDEAGKALNR